MSEIDRAFNWARAQKVDCARIIYVIEDVREQLEKLPKTYSEMEAADRLLGKDITPTRTDPVKKANLEATLKGLYKRLGEADEAYQEARHEFRRKVREAMEEELERAIVAYEARAAALLESWEELVSLDKFFVDNFRTSQLAGGFASRTCIPSPDGKKPMLLDGTAARMYRAMLEDILPKQEARDLFVNNLEVEPPAEDPPEPYIEPRLNAPIGSR